jgi:hypothetical protein
MIPAHNGIKAVEPLLEKYHDKEHHSASLAIDSIERRGIGGELLLEESEKK